MNAHIDSNPGYFDPQAETLSLGERLGRVRGKQEGLRQGEEQGYERGLADGHLEGYKQGVAAGDVQIQRQMEFTRQHIADKAVLTQQLEAQRIVIEEMQRQLDLLDGATSQLESNNASLREGLLAAQEDNERLRAENARKVERHEERSKALAEQVWQYNHAVVFLSAVRRVLERLLEGDARHAQQIRNLFNQEFGEQVSRALAQSTIRTAPQDDQTFARLMPRTQEFISRMLGTDQRSPPPQQGTAQSRADVSDDPAADDSRFET
jgi:hypothetical protein